MNDITLRPVLLEDEAFLFKLFISSRPDLQCIEHWEDTMKETLFRQQYLVEKLQLEKQYYGERFHIVLYNEIPIGRYYVHCGANGFRIIAIALLPEFRNQGIGSYLLKEVMREAATQGKSVFLSVAWYNCLAKKLYQKLGFFSIEDTGVCCEMEWNFKKGNC